MRESIVGDHEDSANAKASGSMRRIRKGPNFEEMLVVYMICRQHIGPTRYREPMSCEIFH